MSDEIPDEEIISLVPEEYRFKARGHNGFERRFVLRGASGVGRDTYLNNLAARVGYDAEGRSTGIKDFGGLHGALLVQCLFTVQTDGSEVPITVAEINAWPAAVTKRLFEKAKVLSALDDEAPAAAKKP